MIDIKRAGKLIMKKLEREWGKLDFDTGYDKTNDGMPFFYIKHRNLSIKNHDDDILFQAFCFESGRFNFYLTFDSIEKDKTSFSLINKFNMNADYFCAYINSDGFLELKYQGCPMNEEDCPLLVNEILSTIADLADNGILQSLTELTE